MKKQISILAVVVVIFVAGLYIAESYFKTFLREKVGLQFKDATVHFFTKTIEIDSPLYKQEVDNIIREYSGKNINMQIGDINFGNKYVQIKNAEIKDFAIKSIDKTTSQEIETGVYLPLNNLSGGIEGLFSGLQLGKSGDYLYGRLLDEEVTGNVTNNIKNAVKEEIKKVNQFESKLKEWYLYEKDNKNMWTLNVEKLKVTTDLYKNPVTIDIEKFTNRMSKMKEPVIFKMASSNNDILISGNLSGPEIKSNSTIEIGNFNYKLVPQLEKYITAGVFDVYQQTIYSNGATILDGKITIKNVKFNVENIMKDIAKYRNGQISEGRYNKLKKILENTETMIVDYSFDEETKTFLLKTDLKEKITEIVEKENL